MSTQDVAATTASLAIASDLAYHYWNYGLPSMSDLSLSNNGGLNLLGTSTGVLTTAVASGVASDDLKNIIDTMPKPEDRKVARAAVASAFLSAKTLAQGSAVFLMSFLIPDGRKTLMDYMGNQLAPSLLINSIIAFGVPYSISN